MATVTLNEAQRRRIASEAAAAYPGECCGLMLGSFEDERCRVVELRPSSNTTLDPAQRYVIDPRVYLHADRDARKRGLEVVGIYHSHPDAEPNPSRTDRAEGWPGYVYVIVTVHRGVAGAMRAWRFDAAGEASPVVISEPQSG